MNKKSYIAPEMEQIEINAVQLLSGSAGAGINDDYSADSDNTPDDSQPSGW